MRIGGSWHVVLVVTCKDGKEEARDMPGIVSLFVSVPVSEWAGRQHI